MPRIAKHLNKSTYEAVKKIIEENPEIIKNISIKDIMEAVINYFMTTEREIYLKQIRKEGKKDYANGFYERELATSFGKLNLKVPRVRIGKAFRLAILPKKWKRVDEKYETLLLALLANGYSREQIKSTLKKLNLPYDEEALDFLSQNIYDDLKAFKNRPLNHTYFVVFIDAYHTKVRLEDKQIKEIVIYTAVGVDTEGNREILGYWIKQGFERKYYWADILQDMISRGLRKVRIFVTDDFNGVRELISRLFPLSDHQLCILHVKRNIKRSVEKKDYKIVNSYFAKIKKSLNLEEAEKYFGELIEFLKPKYKELAKNLLEKKNNILPFVKYPLELRKHIYTTNIVEGIDSAIDKMRIELGGYFPSMRILEINLAIQFANLNEMWLKRPLYAIRAYSYEIRQIMTMKFDIPNFNP